MSLRTELLALLSCAEFMDFTAPHAIRRREQLVEG